MARRRPDVVVDDRRIRLASTTTTAVVMERMRGEWRARVRLSSTMTADVETFHVAVAVTADAGGPVFDRSTRFTIPRDHTSAIRRERLSSCCR